MGRKREFWTCTHCEVVGDVIKDIKHTVKRNPKWTAAKCVLNEYIRLKKTGRKLVSQTDEIRIMRKCGLIK